VSATLWSSTRSAIRMLRKHLPETLGPLVVGTEGGEGGAQHRCWAWCPWRVAEEEVEAIIGPCGERRTELGSLR
jgi:hypothetical protein